MHQTGQRRALTLGLILAAGLCACAVFPKCSPENCAMDAKINSAVQAMLGDHPELGPPAGLHVQTINGVVYLNGAVDTDFEVRNAEALARRVADIKDVVNNLNPRNNAR